MKTLLITLAVIIIIIFIIKHNLTKNNIQGSGNIISESRELNNFTSIILLGSIDVNIKTSESNNCVVVADDNLIPYIKTEVVNNKLNISLNESYSSEEKLVVNINTPNYDEVSLSGSGNINILDFKNNNLSLNISGSGNITGNGEVETLVVKINGSGNLMSKEIKSKSATITINGSGVGKVFASDSISAKINGSGNIKYFGNPENVDSIINGSGDINSN
ncbi:DUF2807 domain-containing protein [Candidatus Marinimicrobia bacterium PRS2]|nr:DUF2807 domain-containing protein [Candidatus Marinimicrobia bacterium PRS2]